MDRSNDMLKRSDSLIGGSHNSFTDRLNSSTMQVVDKSSDSTMKDIDTTVDTFESITTTDNSIMENHTTNDPSESTVDEIDNTMEICDSIIINTNTTLEDNLISTATHSISITCDTAPSLSFCSSSSSSSDSTTGSTTSTPHCILKPTALSSTAQLIRKNGKGSERAGLKVARQMLEQEQRVFAHKQCVRFWGDGYESDDDGFGYETGEVEGDDDEDVSDDSIRSNYSAPQTQYLEHQATWRKEPVQLSDTEEDNDNDENKQNEHPNQSFASKRRIQVKLEGSIFKKTVESMTGFGVVESMLGSLEQRILKV